MTETSHPAAVSRFGFLTYTRTVVTHTAATAATAARARTHRGRRGIIHHLVADASSGNAGLGRCD